LFMYQTSLKELYFNLIVNTPIITFISYPGAINCLKYLTKLNCDSDVYSEFFYQLSQLCHNIQYLDIYFHKTISNGLADLIAVQKNLKYLRIYSYNFEDSTNIIRTLTKLPNTLIKYEFYGVSLSFIPKYTNLQELMLFFSYNDNFDKFQNIIFTQLKILRFPNAYPRVEVLIKFLENNGKNLEEFYICCSDSSLCLAVAKFCPNIRNFFSTGYIELELLKKIFIDCQYLESINFRYNNNYIDVWDIIAKYSPKNFYKLKLYYAMNTKSEILSKGLEKFFINWKNRTPQKPLSLIIDGYNLEMTNEIMKVIEKYKKFGTVKECKILN
jgi:hypothetical protein